MKKYGPLQFAAGYLKHLTRSSGAHGIHSPFVFELYQNVIKNPEKLTLGRIDHLIELRKRQHTRISYIHPEFSDRTVETTVRHIARNSSHPKRFKDLLYRLARYSNVKHGLEIGTSLGFSTMYLSSATSGSEWITMEGADMIAQMAEQTFKDAEIDNVRLVRGNFDDTLPQVLSEIGAPLDMVFFDGNHQFTPTLSYFEQCLQHKHKHSVFVFDDINWSPGMQDAWKKIKSHPDVVTTIDLYFVGLVFFDKSRSRENFQLRF